MVSGIGPGCAADINGCYRLQEGLENTRPHYVNAAGYHLSSYLHNAQLRWSIHAPGAVLDDDGFRGHWTEDALGFVASASMTVPTTGWTDRCSDDVAGSQCGGALPPGSVDASCWNDSSSLMVTLSADAGSSPPAPADGPTQACTGDECCADECPAAGTCKVAGTCDEATGQCSAEANAPDGTPCDDGETARVCEGGVCAGTRPPCPRGFDVSQIPAGCDEAMGGCYSLLDGLEDDRPQFRNDAGYHLHSVAQPRRRWVIMHPTEDEAGAELARNAPPYPLPRPPLSGWTDRCGGDWPLSSSQEGSSTLSLLFG